MRSHSQSTTHQSSLSLVSVITHRHLCPRHCDHSQCLSLSLLAFSRRLASLSRGVWPRSLCLVRLPYIRARTSHLRSRALVVVLSLVSLSSVALSFCGRVSRASLSSTSLPSRLVARLSLYRRATRLISHLSLASSPSRVSPPSYEIISYRLVRSR